MSLMATILTAGVLTGLGLLIYGGFFMKRDEEAQEDGIAITKEIKQSVEEADNTLSNINSVSSLIIEEIDMKYNELLFLYQMMDEKKRDLLNQTAQPGYSHGGVKGYAPYVQTNTPIVQGQNMPNAPQVQMNRPASSFYDADTQALMKANQEIQAIGNKMNEVKQFPKIRNQQEILGLHQKGYDVTEIAKMLGIGKGEVTLILDLSKVGAQNGK